jgi:hypothetical protein
MKNQGTIIYSLKIKIHVDRRQFKSQRVKIFVVRIVSHMWIYYFTLGLTTDGLYVLTREELTGSGCTQSKKNLHFNMLIRNHSK